MKGWLWTYGGTRSAPARRCWFELSPDGATLVWRSDAGGGSFDEFHLPVADVTSVYVGKPKGKGRAKARVKTKGKGVSDRRYDIWGEEDGGAAGGAGGGAGSHGEAAADGAVTERRRYTRPKDRPYTFTVAARGTTLLLQAPNAFELVSWLHALRAAVCGRLAAATGSDPSAYYRRVAAIGSAGAAKPSLADARREAAAIADAGARGGAGGSEYGGSGGVSRATWEVPRHLAVVAAGTASEARVRPMPDTDAMVSAGAPNPRFLRLMNAVSSDNASSVRAMLKESKDSESLADAVEAVDEQGDTPLIVAARAGAARVVGLLLRRGARVYAVNTVTGESALHAAATAGSVACIAHLLEAARKRDAKRARKKARKRGTDAPDSSAEAAPVLLAVRSDGGMTPLHAAAASAQPAALEALLVGGGDAYETDDSGWTIAHYAAYSAARRVLDVVPGVTHFDDRRSIRTLAVVCDVAIGLLEWSDSAGNTPLHIASSYGWTAGVRVMLESAANPHARNLEGQTPVDLARDGGHSECALMLDYYHDSTGLTPAPPGTLRGADDGGAKKTKKRRKQTRAEKEAEMARILAVWDRFFSNAIMGVEAMAATESPAVAGGGDGDDDSSDDDAATRLACWSLDAKAEGVTWSRGHFAPVRDHDDAKAAWDEASAASAAGEWEYAADGSGAAWSGDGWYDDGYGSYAYHDASVDAAVGAKASHWEEVFDADVQASYWYNHDTGESTWEKPADIDSWGSDDGSSWAAATVASSVPAEWGASAWDTDASGWRAAIVSTSDTSETTTTAVALWAEGAGASGYGSVDADGDAPAWEAYFDADSGFWYWSNGVDAPVWADDDEASAESGGWQALEAGASSAAATDYYASAAAYADSATDYDSYGGGAAGTAATVVYDGSRHDTVEAVAATSAASASPLPAGVDDDGWQACFDDDSGGWYWYNFWTGETVWAEEQ